MTSFLSQSTLTSLSSFMGSMRWFGAGLATFIITYKTLNHKKIPKSQQLSLKKYKSEKQINLQAYNEYYFDKELEFRKIQQEIRNMNAVSLEKIFIESPRLARDQFIKFIKQTRKRRRLVRKYNENQYFSMILNFQTQIEELLTRNRKQFAQFLKIRTVDLQRLENQYRQDELNYFFNQSKEILMGFLRQSTHKKISSFLLTQILEEQIGFIKNKLYDRVRNTLSNSFQVRQDKIVKVAKTILEDIIYQKYGYESEDIQLNIIEKKKQIKRIVGERNKQMSKMQADINNFDTDYLESEQGSMLGLKLSLSTTKNNQE